MSAVVIVSCITKDVLDWSILKDLQGSLKTRTSGDTERVVKSIITNGFSFPFFVWQCPADNGNYIIDGHCRILAIQELVRQGYRIPKLPVVYISADNLEDAKKRLLAVNTITGAFSQDVFQQLIDKIPDFDIQSYSFPEIDLDAVVDSIRIAKQASDLLLTDTYHELEMSSPAEPKQSEPAPVNAKPADTQVVRKVVKCPSCGFEFTV